MCRAERREKLMMTSDTKMTKRRTVILKSRFLKKRLKRELNYEQWT